jgi:malonyl-CoA O-methyltransferase
VLLSPDETLSGYDRWSANYDSENNPLVAATEFVLDEAPLSVRGCDVLELGCGTGRHLRRLVSGGANSYLGVDGSEGMLRCARGRTHDPRVQWERGDLSHMVTVVPNSRDVVLVVLVLEHLTTLGPLFASAASALRAGGLLRIVDIHPSLIQAGTVAHFEDEGAEVRFTSVAHSQNAVEVALRQTGFLIRNTREWLGTPALCARSSRLSKYLARPVLVDFEAQRLGP